MGVSKDNVGRCNQTHCNCGLNNHNKRRFGPAWTLRGILTSRNLSSGRAWNWALLKFIVARTVTPNEMKDSILMKEVSLGTACPLHFLSENTILEMIKNLKNDQYQFLVDRYQLSLVIILKRVNKTRNYQSMSKDNDKIE